MVCSKKAPYPWRSEREREVFWQMIRQSFGPGLRRHVARSRCSVDENEEIVVDVFGELVLRETAFIACGMHWDFILPIVRDCCARAQQRWRHEFPAIYDAFESPDPMLTERRERHAELLAAWAEDMLGLLPAKQREAVTLRVVESRSYTEVAAKMHASKGAVRKNVHAGLERLRKIAEVSPPRES